MKTKKTFLLITLSLCLLMFGSTVYGACTTVRCVGQIERLYINDSVLYISTSGDEQKLSCIAPAGVYITLPMSDPNFNRHYAMILTAMNLGKEIGLRIDPTSQDCSVVYTYIDN